MNTNVTAESVQQTTISTFSNLQIERYHSILPILGKAAVKVISHLKGRGRNSWKAIIANIELVNNAGVDAEYYAKLDQEIDLEENYYTRNELTEKVSRTRFNMGLPAFTERISSKCEQEMFKLFMWEDVVEMVKGKDGELRSTLVGYRPICRLKAD